MTISLRLLESNSEIKKRIHEALADHLNSVLAAGSKKLKTAIRSKIPRWIGAQPEIESLLQGGSLDSLNAHFGLPRGTSPSAVNAILQAVSESIIIKTTKIKGNTPKGGIEFSIQPSNLANLLALRQGHVTTNKQTDLHWLDWLLRQGSAVIISGYEYSPRRDGRSGGGVMTKGSLWRVPPQFAGTLQNNFITKALSNREKELTVILKDVFK